MLFVPAPHCPPPHHPPLTHTPLPNPTSSPVMESERHMCHKRLFMTSTEGSDAQEQSPRRSSGTSHYHGSDASRPFASLRFHFPTPSRPRPPPPCVASLSLTADICVEPEQQLLITRVTHPSPNGAEPDISSTGHNNQSQAF